MGRFALGFLFLGRSGGRCDVRVARRKKRKGKLGKKSKSPSFYNFLR